MKLVPIEYVWFSALAATGYGFLMGYLAGVLLSLCENRRRYQNSWSGGVGLLRMIKGLIRTTGLSAGTTRRD